jgi:hypothetical protein
LRRALAAVGLMAIFCVACGEPHQDISDTRRAISRTEAIPHVIRYREQAGSRVVEVSLRVEDSFRSQVIVKLDGVPLFEEALVDDAVAVRLLAPDRWNPAEGTPLAAMLGSGRWVVDPAGAPPVLLEASEVRPITGTGVDAVFDAENAMEYSRAAVQQARGVARFNEDSLQYRPSEDPFRDLVDADQNAGIVRFDAVPPPLARSREQAGGGFRLPDVRFFRKLAVYVKNGRVIRVRELIDFEHHRELLKAKSERKPKYLLEVLDGLRKGEGDTPVRPRFMSIDVVSQGGRVDVALPSDSVTANLGSLLESNALSKLPTAAQLKAEKKAAAPAV